MIKKRWSFIFHSFSRILLFAAEEAQTSTRSPPSNSSPSIDLMIVASVLDLKTTNEEFISLGLPQPGAGDGKSSNLLGWKKRVWRHRIPNVVVLDDEFFTFSMSFINCIPFPFWPFTWKIRHVSFHSESFHCGNKLRPRVSFSFKPSSVTSNLERSAEPKWPWISTVHSVHSTSAMIGVYQSLVMGRRRECTCQCACVECQPDWLQTQCYKHIN